MTRHPIARLEHKERAGLRPRGYVAEVVAAGSVIGPDVWLTPEAHAALCAKYRPETRGDELSICLRKLREEAAMRPPGFAEAVLAVGRIAGGNLIIPRAELAALRQRFKA